MHVTCGSLSIINSQKPGQGIQNIVESGYRHIMLDLSMICPSGELEDIGKNSRKSKQDKKIRISERPEAMYESVCKLLEQCERMHVLALIGKAPYLSRNTKRGDLNPLTERLAKESIRVCGRAGCSFVIVRPLFAGIESEQRLEKENMEFYLRLADVAKENGIQILLENQCRDVNGHLIRGLFSDGSEAAQWVDDLNRKTGENIFGFCMDTGTCSLCGVNMYDFVLSLGKRLKAVVIRECIGNEEISLLPFTGGGKGQSQTDWLNLVRGLCKVCFDGGLIMDFSDTMAVSPLILRPEWIRMSKLVADYFKWQIGMESTLKKYPARVLFGAGNMCRNYMKCYGEQYPPLFTCDNNKMMWGKEFCGLKVEAPESLKELPEDCAVFICNIYYKEIETQLRDMGITNPIEYFNDENMPSFYFDRLDVEARKCLN